MSGDNFKFVQINEYGLKTLNDKLNISLNVVRIDEIISIAMNSIKNKVCQEQ